MLSDKTNSVRKTPNGQNYYGGTINYREMKGRQFISHLCMDKHREGKTNTV